MAKYSKSKLERRVDACIFCGVRSRKLTGEHFWPEWASKALGISLAEGRHQELYLTGIGKTSFKVGEKPREANGNVMRKTIHAVCAKCNNGWMNDWEKAMQAINGMALIRGEPLELSTEMQETIAKWAFLKVMVGEFNTPKDAAIAQEARTAFKNHGEMPPQTSVYIATCGQSFWRNAFLKHAVTLSLAPHPPADRHTKNAQSTAFGIGALFICTLYSRAGEVNLDQRIGINPPVRRIWPLANESLTWPLAAISVQGGHQIALCLDNLAKHPRTLWMP